MFVLDTNALIYYLADREDIVNFINKHRQAIFFIPTIVVAEFLSYPLIDRRVKVLFENFLNDIVLINLDLEVAKQAAKLRSKYRVKLMDAVVAASTLITDSALITYNARDFRKIPELRILAP